MATYNLTSTQRGGQRIVSDSSGNNAELEKRVSSIENKLDTILTLLNKEANNDKNRPKPVSGDDSGV
jgi:hypothetical protein